MAGPRVGERGRRYRIGKAAVPGFDGMANPAVRVSPTVVIGVIKQPMDTEIEGLI